MITGVRGTLEARGQDWVQVGIGGISLQIYVPPAIIGDLGGLSEEVFLHTRLYVRDDEPVLYGFPNPESLNIFQMLNGVSGIGPRTALALLSSMGPRALVAAVVSEDIAALSQAPGVGRRSAGRLVLDLKGKFSDLGLVPDEDAPGASRQDREEVATALMALGYSASESRRAVESIDASPELSVEETIRLALRQMSAQL